MNEAKIFKTTIGGREMTVEIGKYCGLSNGSCIIKQTSFLYSAGQCRPDYKGSFSQ